MTATDPLVAVPFRDIHGHAVVSTFHTFRNASAKVDFLARRALEHAPRVRILARQLGSLEAVHVFVRDWIAYLDERIERLESPSFVLAAREADCDGKGVLLAALVAALGGACELVPMGGTADNPQHLGTRVCASLAGASAVSAAPWEPLGRAAPPGWTWAETTIAAEFGELPGDAAVRLGVMRADVR